MSFWSVNNYIDSTDILEKNDKVKVTRINQSVEVLNEIDPYRILSIWKIYSNILKYKENKTKDKNRKMLINSHYNHINSTINKFQDENLQSFDSDKRKQVIDAIFVSFESNKWPTFEWHLNILFQLKRKLKDIVDIWREDMQSSNKIIYFNSVFKDLREIDKIEDSYFESKEFLWDTWMYHVQELKKIDNKWVNNLINTILAPVSDFSSLYREPSYPWSTWKKWFFEYLKTYKSTLKIGNHEVKLWISSESIHFVKWVLWIYNILSQKSNLSTILKLNWFDENNKLLLDGNINRALLISFYEKKLNRYISLEWNPQKIDKIFNMWWALNTITNIATRPAETFLSMTPKSNEFFFRDRFDCNVETILDNTEDIESKFEKIKDECNNNPDKHYVIFFLNHSADGRMKYWDEWITASKLNSLFCDITNRNLTMVHSWCWGSWVQRDEYTYKNYIPHNEKERNMNYTSMYLSEEWLLTHWYFWVKERFTSQWKFQLPLISRSYYNEDADFNNNWEVSIREWNIHFLLNNDMGFHPTYYYDNVDGITRPIA